MSRKSERMFTQSHSVSEGAKLEANRRARAKRLLLKLTGRKAEDLRKQPHYRDRIGEVYGILSVVSHSRSVGYDQYWMCRCECGSVKELSGRELNRKRKSCGCLAKTKMHESRITHGMSDTSEYRIWHGIKARCSRTHGHAFPYYKAKGIMVCERWVDSFENFLSDMGPRPSPDHSIDRFPDRDGDYEPSNCRWATWEQQQNNHSNCRILEMDGRTQSMSLWSKELGLNYYSLRYYITKGLSLSEAIKIPAVLKT